MIRLTRLRHQPPLYLNPDHIERLERNFETVVRLTTGTEYVVSETPEEIVALVRESRARVIALAALLDPSTLAPDADGEAGPHGRAEEDRGADGTAGDEGGAP